MEKNLRQNFCFGFLAQITIHHANGIRLVTWLGSFCRRMKKGPAPGAALAQLPVCRITTSLGQISLFYVLLCAIQDLKNENLS